METAASGERASAGAGRLTNRREGAALGTTYVARLPGRTLGRGPFNAGAAGDHHGFNHNMGRRVELDVRGPVRPAPSSPFRPAGGPAAFSPSFCARCGHPVLPDAAAAVAAEEERVAC